MIDWLTHEGLYAASAPFFIAFILLELVVSWWFGRALYKVRDTATNVYLATLNIGLDALMKTVSFLVLGWFYSHRIYQIENPYLYWFLALVIQDFLYYIHHCADHYIRICWAVHVTHHSSEEFNITTGFRSPVFQPLYRYWFFTPMALLGFAPLHIMFAYAVNQTYGTLMHTQTVRKLPSWYEFIFVTPSHHRVHHASNPRYLDRNMGMVLIIWDRIFGTFTPEDPTEPVRYGLTKNLEDKSPLNVVLHEWKSIVYDVTQPGLSFKQRLGYLFAVPGWSHDGSRMTSQDVRLQSELSTSADATFAANAQAAPAEVRA